MSRLSLRVATDTLQSVATRSPVVVNDRYLEEVLLLGPAFIKQHARRMGSFGRPRRFLLGNVQGYLQGLAEQSMQKAGVKKALSQAKQSEVRQFADSVLEMVRKRRNG